MRLTDLITAADWREWHDSRENEPKPTQAEMDEKKARLAPLFAELSRCKEKCGHVTNNLRMELALEQSLLMCVDEVLEFVSKKRKQ